MDMLLNKKMKAKIPLIALVFITFIFLMVYYILVEDVEPPQVYNTPSENTYNSSLKYILIWTNPKAEPIVFLGDGQNKFLKSNCPVSNCFVTSNRNYMINSSDFDVVLFHGPDLSRGGVTLPKLRSSNQQYVFVSMESSHYYPIKNMVYKNYFNWTWTYKLNSDLYYGYMIIRNEEGDVIGPKENMHWLDVKDMEPINNMLKEELSDKRLAAAWIVSNCKTPGKREEYVKELKVQLAKYNLTLDIYGKCGQICAKDTDDLAFHQRGCQKQVKSNYYFYLSFENSFSEDYVTEKLLTALLNNAVPIVYGGANYTRFMPDGAYLNARELGAEKLASRMFEAIKNNEIYYEYFKWRNHYSYHRPDDSIETNSYCNFCSKVNENQNTRFHEHLDTWWNR